jgi:hypothetical protein
MTINLTTQALCWVPRAEIKLDVSALMDDRKVKEKSLGAFPGELGYKPDEDEETIP